MADQLLSIAKHDTLPESYIRPESERPGLAHVITDADVPVVDLGSPDKPQMISQIANACQSHGFFQVVNHGVCLKLMRLVMDVGRDFFHLTDERENEMACNYLKLAMLLLVLLGSWSLQLHVSQAAARPLEGERHYRRTLAGDHNDVQQQLKEKEPKSSRASSCTTGPINGGDDSNGSSYCPPIPGPS